MERLEIDDALGTIDFRRGDRLLASLLWCLNPTDRTRFGWLLYEFGNPEEQPLAVYRIGPQAPQDALWAARSDRQSWNARAERVSQATRREAVSEAVDFLGLAEANP